MKRASWPVVPFQALVQDFFEKHLVVERHLSRHTVLAYRDALKLLLRYAADDSAAAPISSTTPCSMSRSFSRSSTRSKPSATVVRALVTTG